MEAIFTQTCGLNEVTGVWAAYCTQPRQSPWPGKWGREHSQENTQPGKRGAENAARETHGQGNMGQRTQPGKHGAESIARETHGPGKQGREHSQGNTWPGKHGAESMARETQSRVLGQRNTVSTSHVWHTTPAPLLFLHNSWMDQNRIENETNKNNIIASNLQLLD